MDIAFFVKQPRVLDQMDEGWDELMSAAHAGKAPPTSASMAAAAKPTATTPEAAQPEATGNDANGEAQSGDTGDDTVFGITLLLEEDEE
ncbi:MAG: hypothetical protein NTW19_24880 [Planctomycetota bacterium]|nr:hypothetical protein [Planctomycetota bacterium]